MAVALAVGFGATSIAGGPGVGAVARPATTVAQERSVSAAEAAALARAAVTDDDALAELRAVTRVDGRAVDLGAATSGLDTERAARLEGLARSLDRAGGAPPRDEPGAASARDRRAARDVLADDKFRERQVPKPFQGILSWLADRLRPVGRVFAPLADLPGGPFLLGLVVAGVAAAGITAVARRRTLAQVVGGRSGGLVDPDLDPVDLDDRAAAAEAAGDGLGAVRLRYQAGLLRLAREGRLVLRADTTAADAARQVDHPVLHRLTADFEAVVYGDDPATAEVLDRSRRGWAEVLGARSRR